MWGKRRGIMSSRLKAEGGDTRAMDSSQVKFSGFPRQYEPRNHVSKIDRARRPKGGETPKRGHSEGGKISTDPGGVNSGDCGRRGKLRETKTESQRLPRRTLEEHS